MTGPSLANLADLDGTTLFCIQGYFGDFFFYFITISKYLYRYLQIPYQRLCNEILMQNSGQDYMIKCIYCVLQRLGRTAQRDFSDTILWDPTTTSPHTGTNSRAELVILNMN